MEIGKLYNLEFRCDKRICLQQVPQDHSSLHEREAQMISSEVIVLHIKGAFRGTALVMTKKSAEDIDLFV